MTRLLVTTSMMVTLAAVGCGPAAPVVVTATGTVTIDGKPLPAGYVYFDSDDGAGSQRLAVTDGSFEGQLRVGKYRVQVKAFRDRKPPPGAKKPSAVSPEEFTEQYLPARYNTQTELTADVVPGGANRFDFPLKGK